MEMIITVLAHNEERRIGVCLESLLAEPGAFLVHVVVNGSSDRTAARAASYGPRIHVHNYRQGGKSRSWNRFVLEDLPKFAEMNVFVDGDAQILPGSLAAMARYLNAAPGANAVSAVPMNGHKAAQYRRDMAKTHGLFGDFYALRGSFLARLKASGIRLPEDLIGEDSLVGALAKTDLENEDNWSDERIRICPEAGFFCEPVSLMSPATWRMQYHRMINYSVRHFQNQIVSSVMRGSGPTALPREMAMQYSDWLPRLRPRSGAANGWFDRKALAWMATAMQTRT